MRGWFSAGPRRTREAGIAGVVLVIILLLALLFAVPAPKPYIAAQVQLWGLNQAQEGVSVNATEDRGISLDWVSRQEALLNVVAPRDASVTVSSGQDVIAFTVHDLIMYTERAWETTGGQIGARILGGKVVDWHPSLPQEVYVALYDNRFVIALLAVFSMAYIYARSVPRFRRLAPLLIAGALLTYQVVFFLDLTPTLYWDTPLSDPTVRAWLVAQMICSAALIVVWFPLRRAIGRRRPDLLESADRFIERYGLLILVAIPLLQHLIGHGVFGYNLQPTDGRYTYMDWGRAMLDRGVLSFLSRGLLRRMETPLIGGVWALFYGVTGNGYLASALVPMLYFQMVVVGTYMLAKELFDRRAAFYAGLFLALSPLFSYASYFVMSDVPSAAMTVLTLWVFAMALKRDSVPLAIASGICLFLATISKLTAVYGAFLMLVVYFLSVSRSKKILLVSLAFVLLLPIAFVAPYLLQHGISAEALDAGQDHLATWAKRPMFQEREGEPADWRYLILGTGQTHYYMGPVTPLFYFRYLVNGVGFPIVLWAVMFAVHLAERRLTPGVQMMTSLEMAGRKLLALVVWILPLLAFLSVWAMRNTRFSYIAFPAYAMLGACGFLLFKSERRFEYARHGGLLLGLSAIMLSTHSAAHYYNVSYLKNADYRDPVFIESAEPYYYIHHHYAGWHVGWNGGGTDHHFTGSIATDGQFDSVLPFELEQYPDVLEVSDSKDRIDFDTMSRGAEDGCDFVLDGSSRVTFDLFIDGVRQPDRVYVYRGSVGLQREVAPTLPLTLEVD